jgi:hypothetical protein
MSRAFVNEDAGSGETPRFSLPPRDDPSYDAAAARALILGADLGDTASAEAATGYYWGDPKLRPWIERMLEEARQDGDERLEQLTERFLRVGTAKSGGLMLHRDEGSPAPDVNETLNPHRGEEQERAREHAADVLARRGVLLFGNESDDDLADLWSAVDRFESLVEARGGDTMINSPESSEPDNPAFVLPERKARESAHDYARRINEAAGALSQLER